MSVKIDIEKLAKDARMQDKKSLKLFVQYALAGIVKQLTMNMLAVLVHRYSEGQAPTSFEHIANYMHASTVDIVDAHTELLHQARTCPALMHYVVAKQKAEEEAERLKNNERIARVEKKLQEQRTKKAQDVLDRAVKKLEEKCLAYQHSHALKWHQHAVLHFYATSIAESE